MTDARAHLSGLIGRIYDCVLDPQAWSVVLDEVRAECGFITAVLAVNALDGRSDFFASACVPLEDWREIATRYGSEIIAMWGGPRINLFPVGEPYVLSHICRSDVMHRSRYYLEWCRERDWGDAVSFRLTDDPTHIANVAFTQAGSRGAVTTEQLDTLRLLAPHVRRVVTISGILDHKSFEAASLRETIDALQSGVVLVDDDCRVVYANAAAQAMLAAGEPIQDRDGTVAVTSQLARDALATAVRQAARDETLLGERGLGIPVGGPPGEPAVVTVMPLRKGPLRPGVAQRAAAALFVHPATSAPQMPRDALVLRYDLTPAEVRVSELVGGGAAPADIARILGLSVHTVRSHLSHVFAKTGTRRQADLVRLLAAVTPSPGAGGSGRPA